MDGKVVGISTAIFSRSGGSQGVGFAIPSNMVAMVVHGAVTEGKIVRPWLGTSGQAVTAEIAQSLGLERPTGVLINEVYPAGPAERGGLKVGDVVRAVDGRTVDDPPGLVFRIGTRPVGGSVTLSLLRGGETIVMYTDGIIEAHGPAPERELFGLERMDAALSHCTGAPDCVIDTIHGALFEHVGGMKREDDQTVVVLRVTPTTEVGRLD